MIKIRATFYILNNGKEIKHVNGAYLVQDIQEALVKARDFVKKYYNQVDQISIIRDDDYFDIVGSRIIIARSDIDSDMVFILVINKLN